jgi:hypothetical protein
VDVKKRKWWMRRRTIICGAIAVVVLIPTIFVLFRWRSNVALAKELRTEIDAWLQALPKIPDSENGALPILSSLEAFKSSPPARLYARDFSMDNESDKASVKQYLIEKEEPLRHIYEGLSYKKFMFPDEYRKGYARGFSNIFAVRNAAALLELKGNLLESEGKKSDAFNEYLNILRLGETLSNERGIIPRMIEAAILDRGFKAITFILSERSVGEKDDSASLRLLIDLYRDRGDFFTMMDADYYSFLILVANIAEGKIGDVERPFMAPRGSRAELLLMSKYLHNYRYDVEIYRKANEIFRRTDPAKYYALPPEARSKETFLKTIGVPTPEKVSGRIIAIALGPPSYVFKTLAGSETLWRGAILLAAIRLFEAQNSRLPKNLTELGELVPKKLLIDPFSGKEIIYRIEGNDFYLYSVGLDGVDEYAMSALPYFKENGAAYKMQDIIFHAPAPEKE